MKMKRKENLISSPAWLSRFLRNLLTNNIPVRVILLIFYRYMKVNWIKGRNLLKTWHKISLCQNYIFLLSYSEWEILLPFVSLSLSLSHLQQKWLRSWKKIQLFLPYVTYMNDYERKRKRFYMIKIIEINSYYLINFFFSFWPITNEPCAYGLLCNIKTDSLYDN